MINSMTAFARAEQTVAALTVGVEIRTYNSRHLDVVLRLPHGYHPLEDKIRARLSQHLARGRVELKLTLRDASEAANAFEVNLPRAAAYCDALRRLKAALDLQGDCAPGALGRNPGSDQTGRGGPGSRSGVGGDRCRDRSGAGDPGGHAARRRPLSGRTISKSDLARIEAWLEQIAQASGGLLDHYQARLKERIAALTQGLVETRPGPHRPGDRVSGGPQRHLRGDRARPQPYPAVSRRHGRGRARGAQTEFPAAGIQPGIQHHGVQNRKGSVAHLVVEVKCELEKIREQVQNVE